MARAAWLERQEDKRFHRKESEFREQIAPGGRFPPETGRYHLYTSWACPWAHRTLLTRTLVGLEDAITFDVVDWHMQPDGSWQFDPAVPGATPDTRNGAGSLQEVYQRADPGFAGIGTVPVLWDDREGTIVNNESREIVRMLDTAFDGIAERPRRLLPDGLEDEVDAMITANYESVNNGVYKSGFAQGQEAYDEALTALDDRLVELDRHLEGRDWLVGPGKGVLTEADVCLWPTLIRYDPVYHTHFKCNRHAIRDLPHLWAYTKRFWRLPGVRETVHWDHIRNHYYWSHEGINPHRIVAAGPDMDALLSA